MEKTSFVYSILERETIMVKKCIDENLLTGYINGNLSDAERKQVEKHLLICEECFSVVKMSFAHLEDSEIMSCEPVPLEEAQAALKNILERKKNKTDISGQIKKVFYETTKRIKETWQSISLDNYVSQPAFARIRSVGVSSIECMHFQKMTHSHLKIEIYAERTEKNQASLDVKLLKKNLGVKNVRLIFLRKGGGPRSIELKGEYIPFENMQFGSYTLIIKQDLKENARLFFELNKEGLYEK